MEWEVLQNIVPYLNNVKQLGVEIHMTRHRLDTNITRTDYIEKFRILKSLENIGFKKFNYRLNPFGVFKSNITGVERCLFYELHYLNFDFVDLKHLKDGHNT